MACVDSYSCTVVHLFRLLPQIESIDQTMPLEWHAVFRIMAILSGVSLHPALLETLGALLSYRATDPCNREAVSIV
jgi:hypothetical protein